MSEYTKYGPAFMVANELIKDSVEIIAREPYSDNENVSDYLSREQAAALIAHLRRVFKFGVRVRIQTLGQWRYVKSVLHDQIELCRDMESAQVFTDFAELIVFQVMQAKYGVKYETEATV